MRGVQPTVTGLPQAAAVLDLAMAGVAVEMADAPFAWLGTLKPAPTVAEPVAETAAPEAVRPAAEPLTALSAPSRSEPARRKPVVVDEVPVRVWHEGENVDVVMVVQGGLPDPRCQQLAHAMLAAVGLKDAILGWAGYEGKPTADALRGEVAATKGSRVLVMGQGPLGVLLGRNLGVEGWHAAGGRDTMELEGAVGVTYPLELLLKQPLFKRLAWQHLLVWGEHKNNKGM